MTLKIAKKVGKADNDTTWTGEEAALLTRIYRLQGSQSGENKIYPDKAVYTVL